MAEIIRTLSLLPQGWSAHDDSMSTCVVVVYDGLQLLDLAGPLEVLRTATRLGAVPGYDVVIASKDGQPVTSESGVQLAAHISLRRLRRARTHIDILLVVGGAGSRAAAQDAALVADVAALSRSARQTASVCTGAFVLAAAGILAGRQATTHWAACDELASAYEDVEVVADRIYVRDGDVWTSAGVTAGIDLALAVVDADHGPELSHNVARWLVVFTRRPGGQAQFSAQLRSEPGRTPPIAELQRWMPDHLADDLTVDTLAYRSAMSPRTFARTFRSETGTTPAAYVESLRVEAARRLLETSDLTVDAIATAVGLRHGETLHRAFRRRVATTPDRYRQHFARRVS